MTGCSPVLHFRMDLSLDVHSFRLANRINSFSSSFDNSPVSLFARHSSMVADFNVGRLREVVEPATLEADKFSQTNISGEFLSFLFSPGVSKLSWYANTFVWMSGLLVEIQDDGDPFLFQVYIRSTWSRWHITMSWNRHSCQWWVVNRGWWLIVPQQRMTWLT